MKNRILFFTMLLWGVNLFSQNYLDVIRPFRGMRGISGSESGVVPASMGASNALMGNPALLSFNEKAFFAADLSYDQVTGRSVFNSTLGENPQEQNLRFNSLTYIKPIQVYRGAWVWGVNLQRVNSFSSISQFNDFDPDGDFYYKYLYQETGDLYALTAGTSVMVTMNTSIGYGLSFYSGKNSFSKLYEETDPNDLYTFERFIDSLQFSPSYRGFGARLGLLSEVSDNLNLGISIELPSRISVDESTSRDSIEWYGDGNQLVYSHDQWSQLEYTAWGPWRLGLGIGFVASPFEASINYRFHSYSTVSMKGDLFDSETGQSLEQIVDEEVNSYVQNVHEFSASLLWALDPLKLSFAATLMNDPLNYRFDNIIRMDVGIGYQLRSGIGFTLALRNEQWQSDLNHTLESSVERTVDVENSLSNIQFGLKYIL
ncbi:MAG: hypothetical protein HOD43_01425 [Candidatus Marinimicrobia bacterium]|jgi:hypothetical protein|nr:hypothetical protein [Candidatus Neomarinimicrobiota bacterium]MBT3632254.1 hypothetical protein [Candidatus Neomarinimicrobiota bacterium]MBT3825938.1 hypothetical protein [Candidatus Neomarinimicrobiota bacterium]MBT4129656.1 hypothetical protein [Candidatus Neomarinimicrobiota bacterium]MBT4294449.1 hypothetical protein [Candidatus Neomarinimicrobiota bacterium]